MSDARLRELERRWRQTGAAEDQAAYLKARVDAGEFARERVALAARLGDAAAALALGLVPTGPPRELLRARSVPTGEVDEATGLPFGRDALVELQPLPHAERLLAAVVALEALIGWWLEGGHEAGSSPPMAIPAHALSVAREWIAEPDAGNALRALHAARETYAEGNRQEVGLGYMHLCCAASFVAFACAPVNEPLHLPRGRQRRRDRPPRGDPAKARADWLQRSVGPFPELYQAFRGLAFHEIDSGVEPLVVAPGTDRFHARDRSVVVRTEELLERAGHVVCAALIPRLLSPAPAPAPEDA
jgi:hypothetical protein